MKCLITEENAQICGSQLIIDLFMIAAYIIYNITV